MAARAHMHLGHRICAGGFGHKRAPRNLMAEKGLRRAVQRRAGFGFHPISADQKIGFHLRPLRRYQTGTRATEIDRFNLLQQPDLHPCGPHSSRQHGNKISAVDEMIAVTGAQAGQIHAQDRLARQPVAKLHRAGAPFDCF